MLPQVTKAVAVTLDVMQRDDCNIAQATEQWGTLMKSDVIQSNERARTSVEARAAVVLQSGSFFAANMLDPRYLGKNLSEEQRQAGHKFLLDEAGIRFPAKVGVVTAALTNLLADGLPAKYAQDSLPGGGDSSSNACRGSTCAKIQAQHSAVPSTFDPASLGEVLQAVLSVGTSARCHMPASVSPQCPPLSLLAWSLAAWLVPF